MFEFLQNLNIYMLEDEEWEYFNIWLSEHMEMIQAMTK